MSIIRRLFICCLTAVSLVVVVIAAGAQDVKPVQRASSVSFHSVAELTRDPDAQPALQGGIAADPRDWPASFYSTHPGGSCTSTLVGPRALLTAAHCVPSKGTALVTYRSRVYTGVCTHAPSYNATTPNGRTADWALCLMNSDVPVTPFETVNTDPANVVVRQTVVLTGFGCTTSEGTGGNDGVYRIGSATVTALPSGDNNDIQTQGQAALCFGDSGGGAYAGMVNAPQKRTQISVNSRIGVDPSTGLLTKTSFLSSLATPGARTFLESWSRQHGAAICGVSQDAKTCRAGLF